MKRKYKLLTFADREKIAEWCNEGLRPAAIAERLGSNLATIYRELKNGTTGEADGQRIYDPVFAEQSARTRLKNRGRPLPRKGRIAEERAICVVKNDPTTGEIKIVFSGAAPLRRKDRMRIVAAAMAKQIAAGIDAEGKHANTALERAKTP